MAESSALNRTWRRTEEACMADRPDIERPDREIELRRLELRFAAARVSDERAVRRLMQSIDACGQLVACDAVAEGVEALVLIDGYRRVAALRRLGRDTARVHCSSGSVGQALAQRLACA
jgi:ParB-like chromosome segregation protein Spo0J